MNPALVSRTQKERHLFKLSEDDFRDQVVRPLLLLKGFNDGRDLCGPTEQGKDALFYEFDKLGTLELSAVQTKKGNINLAAKASNNAANLIAQLKTAAGTSYALMKPMRKKERAAKVYLIASGKINDAARRHCVDEVSDANLRFLDCDDLIPWIDECMPQLWLDMDANVLTYLSAMERQLAGQDGPFAAQFLPNDKSLAKTCFNDSSVTVYVRRSEDTSVLAGPKPTKGGRKRKDESAFPLYAIPKKPYKKVLLLGDGGSGKTTGLLQIVYWTAKSSLENAKAELIPLLVKATDIDAKRPKELVDFLEEKSRELSLQKKPVFGLSDLNAGRVCAFIDGLDEVGSKEGRGYIVGLANAFSSRFPECSVTITSRPYEFLSEIKELHGFERLMTVPITWKDAEKILDLSKSGKAVGSTTIKESINHLSKVQGFALNPLMVSVYAATSNFDLQDVPPNVTELFKRYTEQMLGRWDEQKGLSNLHRPLVKDFALCSLAFEMHSQKVTSIDKNKARNLIADKLAETGHHEDGNAILQEVLDRSGLFRDFEDKIAFRHHMFQEFFAGRGIPTEKFAAQSASDSWWRRAIVFYFGDNPKSANILFDFLVDAAKKEPSHYFSAACTVGLAVQACYLSSVKTKIDIWKSLAQAVIELKSEFHKDHDAHNEMPILTSVGYYFLHRDSLALSNVAEQLEDILAWIDSANLPKDDVRALLTFALMRLGRFDLVSKGQMLKLTDKEDSCLIAALEMFEATNGRPLSGVQKKAVEDLNPVLNKELNEKLLKPIMKEVEFQTGKHKLLQDSLAKRTRSKE